MTTRFIFSSSRDDENDDDDATDEIAKSERAASTVASIGEN